MGEFELLARVRERLPAPAPRVRLASGDDCAVTVPGGATATSVDALVEGVHFRRAHSSPRQIGRKALSIALSDLAAMGAEPGEAYVALAVPPGFGEEECLALVDGMVEVAASTGTTIAGGDLTRSERLGLVVTVVGHADRPEELIGRDGAQRGDALVLTGELGAAAAGLLTLEHPAPAEALDPDRLRALRGRQLDPTPRLAAGLTLARRGARALIDLSDGLGGDATRIAERSGVGLRIEAARLPLADGVAEVAAALGRDPLELAVAGGEDYELLAALPRTAVAGAAEEIRGIGLELALIGEVAGEGVEIRRPGGEVLPARGFDQLS